MRQSFKRLSLVLLINSLLLAVPVALAAQETPAQASTGPGGLMVLAFLLGVGGILIVGGMMLARDSFEQDDEPKS